MEKKTVSRGQFLLARIDDVNKNMENILIKTKQEKEISEERNCQYMSNANKIINT